MMVLSYFMGQKKFPIAYDLRSAFIYAGLTAVLYVAGMYLPVPEGWIRYVWRTLLLGVYLAFLIKRDLPLRDLPYIGRFSR